MRPIEISAQYDTLKVAVKGRFDMSLCFDLWYKCQLEDGRFRSYLFDLGEVSDLRDSGLAWLMMFSRRAEKTGARTCIINCGPEVAGRCLAAGLNTDPTIPRLSIAAEAAAAVH